MKVNFDLLLFYRPIGRLLPETLPLLLLSGTPWDMNCRLAPQWSCLQAAQALQ
jgi:hypothetical protein